MSSTVLKCNNCNIVINEVLSFVQNKVDVMDEESLVRICSTAFSELEIEQAKNLLFDSMSKQKKTRKRAGKTARNIDDIICLIKEIDPNELPVFVARDLQKLPPVTFDHVDVTRLLKDIIVIQKDLREIQDKYASDVKYATVNELEELKAELQELRKSAMSTNNAPYVNNKRGAFCMQDSFEYDSGPMGLSHHANRSLTPEQQQVEGTSTFNRTPQQPECEKSVGPSLSLSYSAVINKADSVLPPRSMKSDNALSAFTEVPAKSTCAAQLLPIIINKDIVRETETNDPGEGEWIKVQKRRKQTRFTGRQGTASTNDSCKFKAAESKIPLYIYNVSKDTKPEDIADYIYEKMSVTVTPVRVPMKMSRAYDSYKIFIPQSKLPSFENDSIWPQGIYFRRFIYFRRAEGPKNFNSDGKLTGSNTECTTPTSSQPGHSDTAPNKRN